MNNNEREIERVVRELREQNPDKDVYDIPNGSLVTQDIRDDRIRVWYDEFTGKVSSINHG